MLVKMGGAKAGGGVGPKRDVVAFSYLCTHQGGFMMGKYQAVGPHRVLGQCPLHLLLTSCKFQPSSCRWLTRTIINTVLMKI